MQSKIKSGSNKVSAKPMQDSPKRLMSCSCLVHHCMNIVANPYFVVIISFELRKQAIYLAKYCKYFLSSLYSVWHFVYSLKIIIKTDLLFLSLLFVCACSFDGDVFYKNTLSKFQCRVRSPTPTTTRVLKLIHTSKHARSFEYAHTQSK